MDMAAVTASVVYDEVQKAAARKALEPNVIKNLMQPIVRDEAMVQDA